MKKITLLFLVTILLTGCFSVFAQSVGINKDGSTPNSSAILDVKSNSQGMLMPRLTTTERNGISSPAVGLFIFNTSTNCFEAYVNGAWNSVSCPSACTPPPIPTSSSAGSITCTSFMTNWASSTGAGSYFLDVATDVAFTTFAPGYINLNVGNLTSYSVLGLSASTTYYYHVRAATACTSGSSSPITVATLPVPVQPSVITGTATVCQGNNSVAYAVNFVADVAYTWSYSGSGYTQASGGTANSITANFSASATSGKLTVTPSNGCGNGTNRSYDITVNSKPAQPSAITVPTPVCQGTNGVSYSVSSVAGVTYIWSYSGTGYTQASGTNSNSITANFSADATSGTLTVTPHNDCGDGTAQTVAITINSSPAQPSVIVGSASACQGASGVAYSVTDVPDVTYTWTYSGTGYTQVTGTTTHSITANFAADATSGTLTVTPSNTCGTGTVRTLAITANSVPASPTAGTHTPSATQIIWNWTTVSGATGYKWSLTNDYASATHSVASPTYTQTGLTCNSPYTLYVWAYNDCFNSVSPITLTQTSGACSITYNYTGAQQTFTVPAGINSLNVSVYGASGTQSNNGSQDGAPGKGGMVQTTLAVTSGSTIYIYVGGQSNWNGGGQKGLDPITTWWGGPGGDASDIRVVLNDTDHRMIVAGGGGGSGCSPVYPGGGGTGGDGGAPNGYSGSNGLANGYNGWDANGGIGGQGAFIDRGGSGGNIGNYGGTPGTGGQWAIGGTAGHGRFTAYSSYENGGTGGGGGGGYYGGGGGAGGAFTGGGGGGGGSSYAGYLTSNTTFTVGNNSGNGKIIISY